MVDEITKTHPRRDDLVYVFFIDNIIFMEEIKECMNTKARIMEGYFRTQIFHFKQVRNQIFGM